jgi:hypothetical protein
MSTISFIQASLQYSVAASRVLPRTVAVKGIDMALTLELWIMGLNIPSYTLFCMSGTDRLRTCNLAKNMNMWMLPGFSG